VFDPEAVAAAALTAIRRNQGLVVIGPFAKITWWLTRLSPTLVNWLTAMDGAVEEKSHRQTAIPETCRIAPRASMSSQGPIELTRERNHCCEIGYAAVHESAFDVVDDARSRHRVP